MTTQERFDMLMQQEKESIRNVERLQNYLDLALASCMALAVFSLDFLGVFASL